MASFGRRVRRAGFKLLLIFPYAFVDTSEAWFEPRRRRIAVSAAGPVSDLTLAGVFSIACLLLAAGTIRDIAFQLAFGAYIAALFNLNPFLERDGYHMLVDWLREPGLRRRARAQFAARLAGRATPEAGSTLLARYSAWGLAWSVAAAAFAVVFSLRYEAALSTLVASWIVHVVMVCVWLACLAPVLFVVGPPLRERIRGPRPRAAG
jgi:putative peptide zinc metalloprotease protein